MNFSCILGHKLSYGRLRESARQSRIKINQRNGILFFFFSLPLYSTTGASSSNKLKAIPMREDRLLTVDFSRGLSGVIVDVGVEGRRNQFESKCHAGRGATCVPTMEPSARRRPSFARCFPSANVMLHAGERRGFISTRASALAYRSSRDLDTPIKRKNHARMGG